MSKMKGVNNYYHRELTKSEVDNNEHRHFIGGLWEELGLLQFEFLKKRGLKPEHRLLDVGCGCLRGGVHFTKYLDEGKYYGIDINKSLIDAGEVELSKAGLLSKKANLLVDDSFAFSKFGVKFDYMVSISVFTHLPMNIIIRCLKNVKENLSPEGVYYSTFFLAPESVHLDKLRHDPGNIITNYDSDPFHYSREEVACMAELAQLRVEILGGWEHPRNQKMVAFYV